MVHQRRFSSQKCRGKYQIGTPVSRKTRAIKASLLFNPTLPQFRDLCNQVIPFINQLIIPPSERKVDWSEFANQSLGQWWSQHNKRLSLLKKLASQFGVKLISSSFDQKIPTIHGLFELLWEEIQEVTRKMKEVVREDSPRQVVNVVKADSSEIQLAQYKGFVDLTLEEIAFWYEKFREEALSWREDLPDISSKGVETDSLGRFYMELPYESFSAWGVFLVLDQNPEQIKAHFSGYFPDQYCEALLAQLRNQARLLFYPGKSTGEELFRIDFSSVDIPELDNQAIWCLSNFSEYDLIFLMPKLPAKLLIEKLIPAGQMGPLRISEFSAQETWRGPKWGDSYLQIQQVDGVRIL